MLPAVQRDGVRPGLAWLGGHGSNRGGEVRGVHDLGLRLVEGDEVLERAALVEAGDPDLGVDLAVVDRLDRRDTGTDLAGTVVGAAGAIERDGENRLAARSASEHDTEQSDPHDRALSKLPSVHDDPRCSIGCLRR